MSEKEEAGVEIDVGQQLREVVPECCEADFVSLSTYPPPIVERLQSFLPSARTAVILTHHVLGSMEWVWYAFAAERRSMTCGADLHAKSVAEKLAASLCTNGHARCVPMCARWDRRRFP